jgi:hypothetical protein
VRHCLGIEVCVGTVAVVVEEGLFGAHFQAVLGNLNTYARKAQQSE